jgi:hypothetical protein
MKNLLLIEMFMSDNCLATAEVYIDDEYGYEVSIELVCQRATVATEQANKASCAPKRIAAISSHPAGSILSKMPLFYIEALHVHCLQLLRLLFSSSARVVS